MLPLYAHSKLSWIGLSVENLFDPNAARFGQSVVIVIFDLFIWIWFDLYGNDGFAIHPHVFCSNGSTTPRDVMCINRIPVNFILIGSRFPLLNQEFIEPYFQTSQVGFFQKVVIHLRVTVGFVSVIEPVDDDVTRLISTRNVVFVFDPINGVNVKTSNVVVNDLICNSFRRVDFVSFFLPFFRCQFYNRYVNFTIGDLKD